MLRAMTCRHISRSKHRVKYLAWRDLRVRSRIECEICGLVRPPHPLPEQPVPDPAFGEGGTARRVGPTTPTHARAIAPAVPRAAYRELLRGAEIYSHHEPAGNWQDHECIQRT